MKINCVDLELSIERIEVLLKMGIGKGMERMMEKRIKKWKLERGKEKWEKVENEGIGWKVDMKEEDLDKGIGIEDIEKR